MVAALAWGGMTRVQAGPGPECTTDTLRIVNLTTSDSAVFLNIQPFTGVFTLVDLDSDNFDFVPDTVEIGYKLIETGQTEPLATRVVEYDTTVWGMTPTVLGGVVLTSTSLCLPPAMYHFEVELDPNDRFLDCVEDNDLGDTPDFTLEFYSGKLMWGAIETEIQTINTFDILTHELTCTAQWNGSVQVNASMITITPGASCEAVVTAGSGTFALPQPVQPGNWPYFSSGGLLDSGGARTHALIPPPDGVVYKQSVADRLYREDPIALGTVPVNQDFSIPGTFLLTNVARVKADWEPFYLDGFSSVQWSDNLGFELDGPSAHSIHEDEFGLVPGERPGNDNLYADLAAGAVSGGTATITPTGLQVTLDFGAPGTVEPAFPSGFEIQYTSAELSIVDSRLGGGTLESTTTQLRYNSGACFGGSSPDVEAFDTATYTIAADGAMFGALTGASTHTYNFDAYELMTINEGDLYFPGYQTHGAGSGTPLPSTYLLAGRSGSDLTPANFALFGENAYTIGDGLYGGYNLSQSQLAGENFTVTVACQPLNLTCSNFCKLYGRYGGFNGTLDGAGGLPADVALYGEYDATISRFNISFLDNIQALKSNINGEIRLPFPSDVDIPFTNLELQKCGDPGGAQVHNADRTLAYWQAALRFAGLEFRPTGGVSSCGTQEKTLWTTSVNTIARVDLPVLLETNFLGNGDIQGNKLLGEPENVLDDYMFSIRRVFYSVWNGSPNTLDGLTVVIGDIKLPFWGLTPVKAIVDAAGIPFIFQGRNFAQNPSADDDLNEDGFPDGMGWTQIDQYEADENFYPNVEASFANLIDLNYPVVYDRLLTRFASPETLNTDLIVLDLESSVESINQENTEIRFGVKYEGIPTLNLSQLVGDYADEAITAVLAPIQDGIDTASAALAGNMADLLREPVKNFIQPTLQTYLNEMQTAVDSIPPGPALDAQLDTLVNDFINSIDGPLKNYLGGVTGPVQSEAKKVLTALDDLEGILDTLNISQLRSVLVALIQLTGNDASGVDAVLGTVESAQNTIKDIINEQIRPPIDELLNEVSMFDKLVSLNDIVSNATLYNDVLADINKAIGDYTNSVKASKSIVRNLTTAPLETAAVNALLNSTMYSQIDLQMTKLFAPLKDQMHEAVLSLLDIINNAVGEYLDEIGAAINDQITGMNDVIGVQTAKLNGYAVFSAESLDRLHIGAELIMSTPDEVTFTGAIDMERIKHDGTGQSCGVPDSGETIKVGIMVGGIPISFGLGDMTADIGILLTLDSGGGTPSLRNFAGSITCDGSIGFASVKLFDPAFGIGVGLDENYFYFTGKVKVDGVAAKGGIFLGRTCNGLAILEIIDPEVANVLQVSEMFGIFTSAEAAIPIIDYGCFLRAGATVGVGFWVFINGPQYGAKLSGGLFGEAACIVSVRGKITLIGAKDAAGYVLAGNAWVAGGFGFCCPEEWFTPADVFDDDWCLTCVAYVDIIYRPKSDWNVDYDVDCSL